MSEITSEPSCISGMTDISREAIKDLDTRKEAVMVAIGRELVSRGAKLGKHLGSFEDGTSIGFTIRRMGGGGYGRMGSSVNNRLTITLGGYGHAEDGQAYAEPAKGYDVPKMVERMLERYTYQKERDDYRAKVKRNEVASREVLATLAGEFPELKYELEFTSTPDQVKLRQQYLNLDQARQVAALLVKFKAEKS